MNLHQIKYDGNEPTLDYLRAYFSYVQWEWTWHDDHADYGYPGRVNHMQGTELRAYQQAAVRWDAAGRPDNVSSFLSY